MSSKFPSRVIAAAIAQLLYLHRASGSEDFTYRVWPAVLCNQLVQNLGIITACIPYIKPFLESLESGMIRTDDLRRRGVTAAYGYTSDNSRPHGSASTSSASSNRLRRLLSRETTKSVATAKTPISVIDANMKDDSCRNASA